MKLTLEELNEARTALWNLFNTPMSFKAATEIQEAMDIIEEEFKEISAFERGLLDKYGVEHQDKSRGKFIPPDKRGQFVADLNEFLAANEISDRAMIPVADIESVQITPRDRKAIEKFLVK